MRDIFDGWMSGVDTEDTDIVQNLPFVGVVGITHPESAWIKKTFLEEGGKAEVTE